MQRSIDKARIPYDEDERQQLLAEGLAILCELAGKYRPLPPHGRFSGYASMFLPRRLGDAWHGWHPDHSYVTDPATGKRRWHYGDAAISLDGLYDPTKGSGGDDYGDGQLHRARALRDFVPTASISFPQPA